MGQPAWEHVPERATSMMLSGRQRDWLATVDDSTVVELLDQEDDGELAVLLWPNGDCDDHVTRIPWEGFLDQPAVRLQNAEQEIIDLPETREASEGD